MAYNGWKNYETLNVSLWLDNDQGTQSFVIKTAQQCYDDAKADRHSTREEVARVHLADQLKDYVEEMNPLASDASMFSDLLGAALSEVDWYEMAEHYLADVEKEAETEEETAAVEE